MLNPFAAMIEKQVARMQENVEQALCELAQEVVEGRSENGLVVVHVNGLGDPIDLQIADELFATGDRVALQDSVCEAMTDALRRAREVKRDKISRATPLGALGVELPDGL
jgi:DNA-binding YbaB/EbfC family protein